MSDDLSWNDHIANTINALRKRFFLITRLRHKVNGLSLRRIADSIFNLKVRYGLQMCGKARTNERDIKQGYLIDIQKVQNKLFRLLHNSTIKDKIPTKNIANDLNMLSVNQINAQVKLAEIWKFLNVDNYPQIGSLKTTNDAQRASRSITKDDLIIKGKTELRQSSFINDAAKIWNDAPISVKQCKSLSGAKREIRKLVLTFHI